jgi:branched-chain amino acid transport system substrate-binding protein
MKKTNTLFLFILLLVFLFGCSEEQKAITPSGNTLKIGIIGPMSGPKQALGEDSLEGIRTALHMQPYLNNGDNIQLIIEDDRNEPELAVKAFKKLAAVDKVKAVIVLSTSGSALAVTNLADSYQVPLLVPLATHPEITEDKKFVSQICFDDTIQGKVAALFVRDELLLKRVAVFKNPYSFHSNALANEFVKKFRAIEGEIQDVILISSDPVDYNATLSRLRDQGVQLLYLPMVVEDVVTVSRELENMNWSPEVMVGDSLLSNVIAQQQTETPYLDGFLTIEMYSSTIEATPYGKKASKVFRSLFKTRNSIHSGAGFEGMAILLDAMNRCHNPAESVCINDKLHDTVDFKGIMGKITIHANGKAERPLILNRIHEDKLEFVVKVY